MFSADRDAALNGGVGGFGPSEVERTVNDLVRFGEVHEADYARARVRVLIGDPDDAEGHLITGWLPMAGGRARGDSDWHPLEVGEKVIVFSEGGELQNGRVLPAGFYTEDDPAPGAKAGLWRKRFQDGATVEYDRDSGAFLIAAAQKVTLRVGGASITVEAGKITLDAGGSALVLDGNGLKHAGKNVGKDHKHVDVASGSAISGGPA